MSRAVALLLCVVFLTHLLQTTLGDGDGVVCGEITLTHAAGVLSDPFGLADASTLKVIGSWYHWVKIVKFTEITDLKLVRALAGNCKNPTWLNRPVLPYRIEKGGIAIDGGCQAVLKVCGKLVPHNADKDCLRFDGSWNCYSYAKTRSSYNCDPGCADDEFCNEDIRGLWTCEPRPIDPIFPDTFWRVNVTTMRCPKHSTQDHCQHPGTTGKVWIKIIGARKNTDWLELTQKNGEFEEDVTDEFHFKTPNIGVFRDVWIEHEALDKDDEWGCKEVTVRKNLDKPRKFKCGWIHDQARKLPFPGGISRRSGTVNMSSILRNFAMKYNCCWHNGVCGRCERSVKSQDAAALFDVDVDDHRGLWFGN